MYVYIYIYIGYTSIFRMYYLWVASRYLPEYSADDSSWFGVYSIIYYRLT